MPRKLADVLRHLPLVAATAVATLALSTGPFATAAPKPDDRPPAPPIPPIPTPPGHGGAVSGMEIVWATSDERAVTASCPSGKVAVGGGAEGLVNHPNSPVVGAPNEFPGRTQTPWIVSSRPVGPNLPAPNTGFDFETGTFSEPGGTAAEATGWYGRILNGPGGVRVFAICMSR